LAVNNGLQSQKKGRDMSIIPRFGRNHHARWPRRFSFYADLWLASTVVTLLMAFTPMHAVGDEWSTWTRVDGVSAAGGLPIDVWIRHDGLWNPQLDYGVDAASFVRATHYGYMNSGMPMFANETDKQVLASRVGTVLDSALHAANGIVLPYLSTSNGLFIYEIGESQYSWIQEWTEASPVQWRGRVFQWRTAAELILQQPGQPWFGLTQEYHGESTRRALYRDAIRSVAYQTVRAETTEVAWLRFFEDIGPLKDTLVYLVGKESIGVVQRAKLAKAKVVLDDWEALATSITDPLTETQRHQFLADLADAQVTLSQDTAVQNELQRFLGAGKAKQLSRFNEVVKWLKIIDAVMKAIDLGTEMSRIYYFETLYSGLRSAPQVEERMLALQSVAGDALQYDPALYSAIQDEIIAFNQGRDPGLIEVVVGNLSPEGKEHWFNVIQTGMKMGVDVVADQALTVALGGMSSIPAFALVAVDAYLFGELVDAAFDLAEDSQRLLMGNAFLSLDQFLCERISSQLPLAAVTYPTLSEIKLERLCSYSSLGLYSARMAVERYKAAIEDAGLLATLFITSCVGTTTVASICAT
jgi:hypothetical protein